MKTAIITYSLTLYDSRVQRSIRTYMEGGQQVVLIAPDRPDGISSDVIHEPISPFAASRSAWLLALAMMTPAAIAPRHALSLHRLHPTHRAALHALTKHRPAFIHANDWMTLPAAIDAKAMHGARVVYDTHEMATEEHVNHALWRLLQQSHVASVEGQMIGLADQVITVSPGIARALRTRYPTLASPLTVVRNVPNRIELASDLPAIVTRNLIYAGLLRPERQIHTMLEALANLDARHRLSIMGFGPDGYKKELVRLTAQLGIAERVEWRAAVPPAELVKTVSGYDIGLFLSPGRTAQERNALPNKIFEYIAAGLAVVASGSDDTRDILEAHGNGIDIETTDAVGLSRAIASFSDTDLGQLKAASRTAARQLNWETEQSLLLKVHSDLVSRPRADPT